MNVMRDIISRNVENGSIVVTDKFRSYNFMDKPPFTQSYIHLTVNHNENFVDPKTGANTQQIERLWSELKMMKHIRRGFDLDRLDFYLAEFVWRRNCLLKSINPFQEIVELVKKQQW